MDRPYLVGPDALVDELRRGQWLMWMWEWADDDGDHESWAAQFRACPFPVEVVAIARYSVSFAWNADLPAPPITVIHATIEAIKYMRAHGGIVLPSKGDLLTAQQVPLGLLPRGPNGLRVVDGRHLRSVD